MDVYTYTHFTNTHIPHKHTLHRHTHTHYTDTHTLNKDSGTCETFLAGQLNLGDGVGVEGPCVWGGVWKGAGGWGVLGGGQHGGLHHKLIYRRAEEQTGTNIRSL